MIYNFFNAFKGFLKNEKWQWLREIVLIFGIMYFIRFALINWYVIPTGSMLPTINLGDHVLVNNLAYGLMVPGFDKQVISWSNPERGDIVLFKSPKEGVVFVKRVVGLEGDNVSFERGRLKINDALVQEEVIHNRELLSDLGQAVDDKILFQEMGLGPDHYILRLAREHQAFSFYSTDNDTKSWTVPKGCVMVLGDNRDASNDSRFWGFIETKKLYGKALRVLYSLVPDSGFPPKARWSRFFQELH